MLLVEWVWFLNFLIIAIFPFMILSLGLYGVFYLYAGVGATNVVVSYLIIPETKGLSLDEIQDKLAGRSMKRT